MADKPINFTLVPTVQGEKVAKLEGIDVSSVIDGAVLRRSGDSIVGSSISESSTLTADQAAFLTQFTRDGNRFNLSNDIFVNEANVIEFNSAASGTPLVRQYFTTSEASEATARTITFTDQPIQFADLVGGKITLGISFNSLSTSGSLPELIDMRITWGVHTFIFPLGGISPIEGVAVIEIDLPNEDYTSILNTNCDITLNYNFRGAAFTGNFAINAIVNRRVGPLNEAIRQIANESSSLVEGRVNTQIQALATGIDQDGSVLQDLRSRVSPRVTENVSTPDASALFLNSTGLDNVPTTLSSFSQVSAQNPRFTGSDVALFIAAILPGTHILLNITKDTQLALDNSDPSVEVVASKNEGTDTYAIYRVTGLTSGDIYEVERVDQRLIDLWPTEINKNQEDIKAINARLDHAVFDLPDALVHVLENEVTVEEQSNATIIPSVFNRGLGVTDTQTVFYEDDANIPTNGVHTSKPINETSGNRARRKLIYIPSGVEYTNGPLMWAFDDVQRNLITYDDGVFNAQVFVPAIPAGTRNEDIYLAPTNGIAGPGRWFTIETQTFRNGIPVKENNETFFTVNVPSTTSTLSIQYRGHANGNVFGETTTTLAGVGGSNEVSTTFNLIAGSETATVEVSYRPNSHDVIVSVTETQSSGFPTINDVQVILSYTESRTVPATPESVRSVPIEFEHPQGQVFAIKPSTTGTLVLVGDRAEIDTGYAYATLFGATETGHLTINIETGTFLDYRDFNPTSITVTNLENHQALPQFGLFTTQYDRETVLDIDVTLRPSGFNVNDLPTSAIGLMPGDIWWNGISLQFAK